MLPCCSLLQTLWLWLHEKAVLLHDCHCYPPSQTLETWCKPWKTLRGGERERERRRGGKRKEKRELSERKRRRLELWTSHLISCALHNLRENGVRRYGLIIALKQHRVGVKGKRRREEAGEKMARHEKETHAEVYPPPLCGLHLQRALGLIWRAGVTSDKPRKTDANIRNDSFENRLLNTLS